MNESSALDTLPPPGYVVRPLTRDDAPGVTDCVRQIYGDSYVHPELYDPEAIWRLNQTGELVSVVTLDPDGMVVGHYALERPDLRDLAETGEALVLPEHRHHQLMEAMRTLLESEARRLALRGLYGNVVTNHVFSQRVVERFGELPCAISLGWSPRSFHNMADSLTQRMSEVVYFKYLQRPPAANLYLPDRHAAWCRRIYAQFGVEVGDGAVATPAPASTEPAGELDCEYHPNTQRAVLRVRRIGHDSAAAIRARRDELLAAGAEAMFLELPLAQPATPGLCVAAEAAGFFFSGLGPCFAGDGSDALRLQFGSTLLDLAQIQLQHPLARELLDYVDSERQRIAARAR